MSTSNPTICLTARPASSLLFHYPGLSFKALRVQRACTKVYDRLGPAAVQRSLIGLRMEHYLPWVFEPAFGPKPAESLSLAVAGVLLSDDCRLSEVTLHVQGPRVDAIASFAPALRKEALQLLARIGVSTRSMHEQLRMQDEAIETERQHGQAGYWKTPQEARALDEAKLKHLQALTDVAFRDVSGAIVRRGQQQLISIVRLQQMFNHYLLWNRTYPAPLNNRFLLAGRAWLGLSQDARLNPEALAYGEFGRLYLAELSSDCEKIAGTVQDMSRMHAIASQLGARITRLSADLEGLRAA